ncbi:MAG TPA: serine protease [Anaerolineae bacterium]|nr:serine protease [Anaerolineae bacterium]
MRNALRIGCLMVLLVAILVTVSGVAGQQGLTLAKRQEIMKGSVDITSLVLDAGELVPVWGGSGTIISEDGLVLTNAHVATDMFDEVGLDGGPMDALVIAGTTREDRPPTPMYFAEVVAYDQQIDLALLQITRDLDGKLVDAEDLNLTPVTLGDSDEVHLGDDLYIFGYPTIGEGYITFTSGRVSGFDSTEMAGGELIRTWIRTDTTIAGGNSGGTGVNADGELIGVPTQLGEAEARRIVDTNGDGVIDENDTPVSVGQLNELRPVNLLTYLTEEQEPAEDVDAYEPNETVDSASGPLDSGKLYQAYISSDEDVDVYYVDVETTDPIIVELRNINWRSDYDLYLVDSAGEILDYSWGTTESERIEYEPRTTGTYYIAINTYGGYSVTDPYSLVALFNGDEDLPVTLPGPADDEDQGVTVSGTIVSADTGGGIEGALFVVLQPDVTVEEFLQDFLEEQTYVIAETDREGTFVLDRPIPRGEGFGVVLGAEGYQPQYENGWLHFDVDDPAEVDLGAFPLASQS